MPKTKLLKDEVPPIGAIQSFGGDTAPAGWAICDGSAISRSQYPELFVSLGVKHGEGDGSTTFNLPDLRGRFLRGADRGAGRDPDAGSRTAPNTGGATGDDVGSVQNEELNGSGLGTNTTGHHQHIQGNYHQGSAAFGVTSVGGQSRGDVATRLDNTRFMTSGTGNHTHSISGGGAETRPGNAYVNYIIRIK